MENSVLLNSLQKYYSDNKTSVKLLEILKEKNIIFKIIDWFVTNYSKKNNIYYTIFETPTKKKTFVCENNRLLKQFNTYHIYKSQLKSF